MASPWARPAFKGKGRDSSPFTPRQSLNYSSFLGDSAKRFVGMYKAQPTHLFYPQHWLVFLSQKKETVTKQISKKNSYVLFLIQCPTGPGLATCFSKPINNFTLFLQPMHRPPKLVAHTPGVVILRLSQVVKACLGMQRIYYKQYK